MRGNSRYVPKPKQSYTIERQSRHVASGLVDIRLMAVTVALSYRTYVRDMAYVQG